MDRMCVKTDWLFHRARISRINAVYTADTVVHKSNDTAPFTVTMAYMKLEACIVHG